MKTHSLTILSIVFLISCNHDISIPERSDLSAGQIQKLRCNGFDPDKVEYNQGKYLIDGDYIIGDEHLENPEEQDIMKHLLNGDINDTSKDLTKTRQYTTHTETTAKVTMTNVKNIKYFIDPNLYAQGSTFSWISSINYAINSYTNLTGSSIKFIATTTLSEANLIFFLNISSNPLKPSWWNQNCSSITGQACFPSNGNVGKFIGLCSTNIPIVPNKIYVVTHEIGHALGQRHSFCASDVVSYIEASNVTDACSNTSIGKYHIEGTTQNDCNSVMRPNYVQNSSINSSDEKSWEYMYPNSYTSAVINSGSKVLSGSNWWVTINTSNFPTPQLPYRIVVARYSTTSSTVAQYYSYYHPNNNKKTFTFTTQPGVWRYKVWYFNHGTYGVSSNYYTL